MAKNNTVAVRFTGDVADLKRATGEAERELEGFGSRVGPKLKKAMAGAGIAAGAALTQAFFTHLDQEASAARLGASLGLSDEEAKRLGKIAGDIYTDGWGESFDGVTGAIENVVSTLGEELDPSAVEDVTVKAIALADVFGIDVAGVTFPFTPGIVIGHNDRVAWGFTNGEGDVQDLYLERISGRERSDERVQIFPGGFVLEMTWTGTSGGGPEIESFTTGASDDTPPVTTHALSGTLGSNGWYRSNVTVTLTVTDALSGVASTEYRINGGGVQLYGSPFTLTAQGIHSVEYRMDGSCDVFWEWLQYGCDVVTRESL